MKNQLSKAARNVASFAGSPSASMLDELEEIDQEQVSIDGAVVVVPHACGADGNEHRYGTPYVSPWGNVTLVPQ